MNPLVLLIASRGALCLLSIAFGLGGFRSLLRWLCGGAYDSILANFTFRYRDNYGEATLESMKAFRDRLHRAIFTLATLVGWVASSARCFRTTSLPPDRILQFFIWSITVVQAFALFAEPSPPARHRIGLNGGVNSILLIWALALEKYATTWSWRRGTILDSSFIVAEIVVASVVCFVAILLPRRPDVYWNDGVVDRQFTTSFLKRVSFSWAWDSWKPALKGHGLSVDSFAQLEPRCRSENLSEQLDDSEIPAQSARFLHKTVCTLYRQELFAQAGLAILSSAVSFTPQLALYGIVRTTEVNMGESNTLTTFWICALGLGILIAGALEGWSNWHSTVNLGLRIHKQLTLGVFKKLLASSTSLLATSPTSEILPKNLPRAAPESTERTLSHNLINLVAIDAQQVGMSVRLFNQLYDIPIKLSIAGIIIAQLLGWQSLLAAIGVILVFVPFSIFTAKRSSKSQSVLMAKRDRRMALVSETMHGVRYVKFAGWETHVERKILELRRQELEALWTVNKWNLAMQTVHLLGPLALSATTIVVHVAVTNSLKPSVAFASLSVLDSLETSIARIANLCANLISGSISTGRLQRFLKEPTKRHAPSFADKITFDNATITWPGSVDGFVMPNLNFELPPYALTILIGSTKSGKSLLLNAILGECDLLSGSVKRPYVPKQTRPISLDNWIVDGALSYVAQTAWLENATIKQNILFDLPEDSARYQQVLFACALTQDLATFDEGDQTEIGPKQVNISGGQKMRISLARALYSRAGILVMDDIFSSVDIHTAHHLAIHALNGPIARGRTRILATHHFAICRRYADHVVSIALDSSILTGQIGDFDMFGSKVQVSATQVQDRHDEDEVRSLSAASTSESCLSGSEASDLVDRTTNVIARGFVEQERHLSNGSHFMVLLRYFRQMGGLWYVLTLFTMFLMYIGAVMGRAWWVKHWTGSSEIESANRVAWYLFIYVTITGAASIAGVLKNYLMLLLPLRASQKLFSKLVRSLIHSQIDFLDRTPIGRIINRLSSDMAVVDVMIADFLGGAILGTLEFASIIVAASAVSPVILVVSAVMLLLCFHSAKQFSIVGRHLKQLESISRSPVFEQLNSITDGLVTIRAFGHVGKYQQAVYSKIDDNTRALWNLWLMNCWLGFRMTLIGSLFVTSSSFIVVYISKASVAQIGFALSFAIRYTQVVLTVIRNYIQVELSLNAVDRVFEYSDLPSEEYGGREVAATWPQEGHLRVADLVVRYASHLPPALNGITFEIRPNQRIGVVGRTGAGKSSLAMALFRFLEAEQGCITLDGLDLSSVPLQDLRQRMAFISQEPYLFSGTIRSNLDPIETCSDSELLHALAHVHWGKDISREEADSVSDTSSSTLCSGSTSPDFESVLDFHVSQRGQNLSAGQRQQLCLARAIAARPKILVMDEATSAIDKQTDDLIQHSIRDAFGRNCTSLLVIAHRISTVLDFDCILVLDHGKIVEFGAPNKLLERRDGYFRSLVERSEN